MTIDIKKLESSELKIVKMPIFNTDNKNFKINMEFELLIDKSNFIIDYKVKIKDFFVCRHSSITHKSFENKKIVLRRKIFDELNLTNYYSNESGEMDLLNNIYNYALNKDEIKKLNKILKTEISNLTFHSIEYLIWGSNHLKDRGRSLLKTIIDKEEEFFYFSFFLQALNIRKKINYPDCKDLWKKCDETISFQEWVISDKTLSKYFFKFISQPKNDKKLKKDFKSLIDKRIKRWIELNEKIDDLKSDFKLNIIDAFGDKKDIIETFYGKESSYIDFEYAHIKPLWYIKLEYIILDKDVLNEIVDPYNFVPLPSKVCDDYLKHKFYWDIDGQINLTKNKRMTKNIQQVQSISFNHKKSKEYFKKYIKLLKEKNLIKTNN